MVNTIINCANCDVPILDPTTQVVHGPMTFCCPNCSEAFEQHGSGSDPHTMEHEEAFVCAHCGTAIVDRSTMEEREGLAYCCGNCARAVAETASATR